MLLEALDGYQRGQAEPPLIRKWHEAGARSAGTDQGRPLAFVISTEDVDRHGDVIVAEGWRLEAYRRNPVWLTEAHHHLCSESLWKSQFRPCGQ